MFSGSSTKSAEKEKERKEKKTETKILPLQSLTARRINMAATRRFFKAAVLDSGSED